MNINVMFSSKTNLWETPQDFFNVLDVCATSDNAKCKRFFSPEGYGLKQELSGLKGIRKRKTEWRNGCMFAPSQDRCSLVARLLHVGRSIFYLGQTQGALVVFRPPKKGGHKNLPSHVGDHLAKVVAKCLRKDEDYVQANMGGLK